MHDYFSDELQKQEASFHSVFDIMCLMKLRESFPRQVDRKSRGPQGERGLEFLNSLRKMPRGAQVKRDGLAITVERRGTSSRIALRHLSRPTEKNHSLDYMDLCWQSDAPIFLEQNNKMFGKCN